MKKGKKSLDKIVMEKVFDHITHRLNSDATIFFNNKLDLDLAPPRIVKSKDARTLGYLIGEDCIVVPVKQEYADSIDALTGMGEEVMHYAHAHMRPDLFDKLKSAEEVLRGSPNDAESIKRYFALNNSMEAVGFYGALTYAEHALGNQEVNAYLSKTMIPKINRRLEVLSKHSNFQNDEHVNDFKHIFGYMLAISLFEEHGSLKLKELALASLKKVATLSKKYQIENIYT